MQRNIGNLDSGLRIIVGAGLIALALMNVIGGWGWIGLVPLITGVFRFCPAYRLLGISSCQRKPLDKPDIPK